MRPNFNIWALSVASAMAALHDWVPSPERFMEERLQELNERIKKEGS